MGECSGRLKNEEILSQRLLLWPVTLPLADAILAGDFRSLSARGLSRAKGWPRGDTLEIMSFLLISGEMAGPCWLIVKKNDLSIIGDLGCKGQPGPEGEVEIGYGIVSGARARGYGTEAVKALIRWLGSWPQVRSIAAECIIDNQPSRRLLKRVGMQLEERDGHLLRWRMSTVSPDWHSTE